MDIEQFNSANYLPRGYYPWPDLIHPNVELLAAEMHEMIDSAYSFWPEKVREKYKKMILEDVTARMYPNISLERIRPFNRFMILETSYDDQHELHSFEEIVRHSERVIEILEGDTPLPQENGWFQEVAILRDEFRTYMPEEWITERLAVEFSDFIRYGVGAEAPFKLAKTIPPLELYLIFREYSIGMRSFLIGAEAALDYMLPKHVVRHPVLQRLLALASRMVAWQNDIHSIRKEYGKDTETLNLIIVLQNKYGISLEEASAETLRIHDADMAEYVALQKTLPDFGGHNEMVEKYVLEMGIQVQAINTYYLGATQRYLIRGAGFNWPGM